ncbi:MAG: flagellar basal body P-ring protein FlgI [Hyphomicrobiales bacterium]|nr:flagellar basal body P-ring protein FlgI [Hyphomicrobiales bacterium]
MDRPVTRRLIVCLVAMMQGAVASAAVRIKDVTSIRGMRENQLIGYGLVVGLQGSGDTLRNTAFTEQALQSMLDRMGVAVKSGVMRTRNVAAVMVTAEAPPFTSVGSRIDVTVSSLGDANSLMGGTLIMTPLAGPNGATYASAQGPVSVTGFAENGRSASAVQGVPTAGRIVDGAMIERKLPEPIVSADAIELELRNADFRTAVRIVDAINRFAEQRYRSRAAAESDSRAVLVRCPRSVGATRFLAEIGDLLIEPDAPAKIVLDARSGTIVIGADVQISTVAVTHGTLSVRISETPNVSQPEPLSGGKTVVTSNTKIEAAQDGGQLQLMSGANLRDLVRGLNRIGVKPAGIISILQAIKSAGALQAEIVVQ